MDVCIQKEEAGAESYLLKGTKTCFIDLTCERPIINHAKKILEVIPIFLRENNDAGCVNLVYLLQIFSGNLS